MLRPARRSTALRGSLRALRRRRNRAHRVQAERSAVPGNRAWDCRCAHSPSVAWTRPIRRHRWTNCRWAGSPRRWRCPSPVRRGRAWCSAGSWHLLYSMDCLCAIGLGRARIRRCQARAPLYRRSDARIPAWLYAQVIGVYKYAGLQRKPAIERVYSGFQVKMLGD